MSEHTELEPCPYCGGHASLSKVGRDWYRIAADHVTGCPLEDLQLDCPQSDDQLPMLLRDWNTRVDRSPSNNAEKCDQLRAEVAGLKTGYEAYERVNAELKADNEALRKDSESYRLLSFCHGQGTLELVRSHHELCAEIRRLKILAGEPVPATPEEFVGPSPEGPMARIRRKIAAMGKGEQS